MTVEAILFSVTRRAGADIALGFEGVVTGRPAIEGGPAWWVVMRPDTEGIVGTELAHPRIRRDPRASVATSAEGLQAVTGAALALIAARVDRVESDVVADMKVHRLDDAVVAIGAESLLVTVLAVAGVGLRRGPVVGAKR